MKFLNWLAILLALFLFASFAVVACGDDDDDNDNNSSDDDDDDGGDDDDDSASDGEVWTDSTTGLMWQNGDACCFNTWDESNTYCNQLQWGGYDDWRLPTISELRSLIRGCEATMTGGTCGVTDDCLDGFDCSDDTCEGCQINTGPGYESNFFPVELLGNYSAYFSSSLCEDSSEGDAVWGIGFNYANIHTRSVVDSGEVAARCVRN